MVFKLTLKLWGGKLTIPVVAFHARALDPVPAISNNHLSEVATRLGFKSPWLNLLCITEAHWVTLFQLLPQPKISHRKVVVRIERRRWQLCCKSLGLPVV